MQSRLEESHGGEEGHPNFVNCFLCHFVPMAPPCPPGIQDELWPCVCPVGLSNREADAPASALGMGLPGLPQLGESLEIA